MLSAALLSIFLSAVVTGAPTNVRIVNGTDAAPGQFPFQISLQYEGNHFCGGTIVSSSWILTAAHCVDEVIAEDLTVLAGTNVLSAGGERIRVLRYFKHPGYNPEYYYKNDIAVVELQTALSMTGHMAKVKLPSQSQVTEGGVTSTVIGWGYLFTGGPTSNTLQMVNILTYSDEECQRVLPGYVTTTNICAGVPGGGKGHCGGDSGGPLIAKEYQAGIVSWSVRPCAQAPYPGVYTEVAHYVDWIRNVTSKRQAN